MQKFEVHGLQELEQALQELPLRIEKNLLRRALRQGGNVFLNEARARVPVQTGKLKRSIRVRTDNVKNGGVRVQVSARAWYAHMIEFGTKAHQIKARGKGVLAFDGRFVKSAQHPGAKAKPFMRPAFDGKQREAVEAFRAAASEELIKEVFNLPKGRRKAGS